MERFNLKKLNNVDKLSTKEFMVGYKSGTNFVIKD